MWNFNKSVTLSLIACFLVGLVLVFLLFSAPYLLVEYFMGFRNMSLGIATGLTTVICYCFYPSAIFAFGAIYSLIKLLFNLKKGDIFIRKNSNYLRIISWCCIAVFFITLAGGFFYYPLFFVSVAAGFVGLILRVVKNVMHSAVIIREENDLVV